MPMIEIAQSSPLDLRKMLTRLAMMMPNRPMIMNEPIADRSRCVVSPYRLSAPNDAAEPHGGGHGIVDTEHVGAQARIDCGGTVGEAAAGRYVPIEVRHWSSLVNPGRSRASGLAGMPANRLALNLVYRGALRQRCHR